MKGRTSRADTVTVTRNEILTSLNEPERWLLALVEVKPGGGEDIRYAKRPFEVGGSDYLFDVTSVNFDWNALWAKGLPPAEHHTQAGLTLG